MTKLFSISLIGLLVILGNPITELKVKKVPTEKEVEILGLSDEEYEVYLNAEGNVEYRDFDYSRVKGKELPFKIMPQADDEYKFRGRQVNLKLKDGWLVGFDRGEWGGHLFWFNDNGTRYEEIERGNITDLFEIEGELYVIEGLPSFVMKGSIFKIAHNGKKWFVEKKVDLATASDATTLTKNNEFLIVTNGIQKVDRNFTIETLIYEGFWWPDLYPNSILIDGETIYIGMRGGILRMDLNDMSKQEWLVKK